MPDAQDAIILKSFKNPLDDPNLMKLKRWPDIKPILDEALELSPTERKDFLGHRCQGNEELQREVEAFLAFENDARELIERPVLDLLEGRSPELRHGERLGPYELQHELAQGGMGLVYLAYRNDGVFRQKVAVKILKRGLDTTDLVRKFRRERQILARLDHPHIARVLDGGSTEDGLPYFVMEYIDGIAINRYAENLSVEDCLLLMRHVCETVHSAHQNLVIHCDLKPSNILVDAMGHPKLLDFGIAKLLHTDEHTGETVPRWRFGTRDYAGPELQRGESITTATDVYSLGALLFHLLTGARPPAEPIRPSHIARHHSQALRLRGDLDCIVLKAMQQDPQLRYPSAAELADDLQRHLERRPVSARDDKPLYLLQSFIRRYPAWTTLLLVLFFGLGILQKQQIEATRERDRAEASRAAYLELIEVIDPTRHESSVKATREALGHALRTEFFKDPRDRALIYDRIGRVFFRLERYEDARPLLESALEIRRNLSPPDPEATAASLNNLAVLLFESGNDEEAKELLLESLATHEYPGTNSAAWLDQQNNLAVSLQREGKWDEAERLYRAVLTQKRILKGDHSLEVAIGMNNLGQLLLLRGELEEAEQYLRNTLRIREELLGPENPKVTTALVNLGILLDARGAPSEALVFLERALSILQQKFALNSMKVARAQEALGYVLSGGHETQELLRAENLLRQARNTYAEHLGLEHASTLIVSRHHAAALLALDHTTEAEQTARQIVEWSANAWPVNHWRRADMLSLWGASLTTLGHLEQAEPLLREAIPIISRERGRDSRYAREAKDRLNLWEQASWHATTQ